MLYYGHLTPWKGVLHLVRGFGAVAREIPDATLVIARTGYGSEEPLLHQTLHEREREQHVMLCLKAFP